MVVSSAIVAATAKAATSWLSGQLGQWLKDKKASAEEAKLWGRVTALVLKQTKVTAERYSKITTVAFPREPVYLSSIYVPVTIVDSRSNQSAQVNGFPRELLENNRKMLIVGVAGMGKSTVSKMIFLRALEEKRFLPILIDLRRLDGSEDIDYVIMRQFGLQKKHAEIFSEFLSTQPLLFIFDGFDEVVQLKKVQVARVMRHFVDRCEVGSFIITSRPELPFSDYNDFSSFRIKELSKDEAYSLIRKYGEAYGIEDRARALLEELNAKHDAPVASFLKNPLLTSLLFRAFEYKSVIPVKRGVFYRQVFDALYESHDLSKETGYVRDKKTGLHHDDFHRALRAMAKLFRERRVIEVDVDHFKEMAREVAKSLCPDLAFTPEAMLHDVLHAVPLFLQDGKLIRWAHKSLLDYFLCEFILRDYSESREEALRRAASAIQSRSNENFLVLVHEADPILFTKAVTIPAIDRLISRYDAILKKVENYASGRLREDIANIFMNCGVVYSPDRDGGTDAWRDGAAGAVLSDDFLPIWICRFSPEVGSVGVYYHEAMASLSVPIAVGTVPHVKGYFIAREYQGDKLSTGFVPPSKAINFIDSRKTKRDWASLEDDFSVFMGLLRGADFKLVTRESLDRAKIELEKLVSASIKARSSDLF